MNRHARASLLPSSVRGNDEQERECDGRIGRDYRQSLGANRAALAAERSARWAVGRPPQGHKWHPLEAEDGSSVAGFTPPLRPLANVLLKSFVRWRRDGTWDRLLSRAQTKSDAVDEVEWEVSVDATTARDHQHATGARREPAQQDAKRGSKTSKRRHLRGFEGN